MSKEFEYLSEGIDNVVQQAFENGVLSERKRVLSIIAKEARSKVVGWEKTDWIVALINGDDK
jgi:hypothetical protein